VSPAVGPGTCGAACSGLSVPEVLAELLAGLEEEGLHGAGWSASNDTVDLGRIGLAAARLAGSGIGIGLQGKGTAPHPPPGPSRPLANLEL